MSMRTACLAGAAALVLSAAAACSSSSSTTGTGSARQHHAISSVRSRRGGSITVLESSGYSGAWTNLDPPKNKEGAATQDFMTAIYGQLFELGPTATIVPDLATGYTFSPDAKTLTITLRQGVKFTDGTPFNAQAVYTNWMRDLGTDRHQERPQPAVAHRRAADLPKGAPPGTAEPPAAGVVQVTGPYTIVLHLTAPNGASIDQLFDYDRQLDRLADRPDRRKARRSARTRSAPGRSWS